MKKLLSYESVVIIRRFESCLILFNLFTVFGSLLFVPATVVAVSVTSMGILAGVYLTKFGFFFNMLFIITFPINILNVMFEVALVEFVYGWEFMLIGTIIFTFATGIWVIFYVYEMEFQSYKMLASETLILMSSYLRYKYEVDCDGTDCSHHLPGCTKMTPMSWRDWFVNLLLNVEPGFFITEEIHEGLTKKVDKNY